MLIHLVSTPFGAYAYDANINRIAAISEDMSKFLKDQDNTINKCNVPEHLKTEIEELMGNGFLQEPKTKKITHPLTQDVSSLLERGLSQLVLQVTQNCNFRCSYCSYTQNSGNQRLHSAKKMNLDTAKMALAFFHERSIDSPKINIAFYGGEPLLEFKLIKEIVSLAEDKFRGKTITYNMTTNGSLLTKENLDFIAENKFSLMISLDGPKEIHDRNRKFINQEGTFESILNNIRYMKKYYPELFRTLTINMVLDPSTNFESISFFPQQYPELTDLVIRAGIANDYDSSIKNIYKEQFTAKYFYHQFLEYLVVEGFIQKPFKSNILSNQINSENELVQKIFNKSTMVETSSPGGPCIPGYNKFLVDTEGSIYICEKVCESNAMKIGDIEHGFDLEKVKSLLNIGKLTEKWCLDCWAFRICSSCAKFADDGENISSEKRLEYCREAKLQAHHRIRNLIAVNDIRNHKYSSMKEIKL